MCRYARVLLTSWCYFRLDPVVLLLGCVAGLRLRLRLGGVLVIEEPQQHPVLLLPVHLPLPRPPTLALTTISIFIYFTC